MAEKEANRLHDVLRDDVRSLTGAEDEAAKGPAPAAEALRLVAPRPVPSIVLSVAAKVPQEIASLLSRIPENLDDRVARYPVKIELRFDAIKGFSERMTAAALVFRLGVPIILTLRARREGGHSTATEPERQRFFLSVVSALRQAPPRGSLIDIEAQAVAADPEGWGQVISQAHERGFQVILSHHDLDITPEDPRAILPNADLLDSAPGGGATIWKSATQVTSWRQELVILRALARGNRDTRRAAIMGMGSPTSRLLAPFFGAPLVYAAIDAAHVVAPGQLPFADLVHVWARWGIDVEDATLSAPGERRRLVLLGRPALHSLSPAMHNAALREMGRNERYFPLDVPDEEGFRLAIESFAELGVTGGNVTMPYKEALLEAAEERSEEATLLGAANTFVYDQGSLRVHNTDPHGVTGALREADVDVPSARVLILGAGAAAAAAAYALRDATESSITNRTVANAESVRTRLGGRLKVAPWDERLAAAQEADVIVNTTPIGMEGGPEPDASPLDGVAFRPGQTVFDTVYAPLRTRLLEDAAAAGAATIDGTAMLLHQGAAAFHFWTGQDPPLDAMRAALRVAASIPLPGTVNQRPAAEVRA